MSLKYNDIISTYFLLKSTQQNSKTADKKIAMTYVSGTTLPYFLSPMLPLLFQSSDAGRQVDASIRDTTGALLRRYPHGGSCETLCGDINLEACSNEKFFKDREILAVVTHPDHFVAGATPEEFPHGRTPYGRHVLQQARWTGCGYACASMLMMDHGIDPDWRSYQSSSYSEAESVIYWLKSSGLKVFEDDNLSAADQAGRLDALMRKCYSGILALSGHFIVLDFFSSSYDFALVRDPFHGWAVAVKASAITSRRPEDFIGMPY